MSVVKKRRETEIGYEFETWYSTIPCSIGISVVIRSQWMMMFRLQRVTLLTDGSTLGSAEVLRLARGASWAKQKSLEKLQEFRKEDGAIHKRHKC